MKIHNIQKFITGAVRVLAISLVAFLGLKANAAHELLYAVGFIDDDLFSFYSDTPGNIVESHPITGLLGGEQIQGIDYWQGQIYALGSSSRLYTIDPHTGAATQVGSGPFSPILNGFAFGMDNGPTGLRVVSDLRQNLLVDRVTGSVSSMDPGLSYAAGDPFAGQSPSITALAYDSVANKWYAGDSLKNTFAIFNPTTGVLNTIGPSGIDLSRNNGFDISPSTGIAYLASPALSSDPQANLYTVNPLTGAVTLVGQIGNPGDNILVRGLTVVPAVTPPTVVCPPNLVTNNPVVTFALPPATGVPSPVVTCEPPSGSVFACGTTTIVTCTATNVAGTNTCTFQVTVVDATPPVFTVCPADMNLGCNPATIPVCNLSEIEVMDNCGPVVITCSSVDTRNGCILTRTITYTATDTSTNRATCVQRITWIEDLTPPVFTVCPPNLDLGCNPAVIPGCNLTAVAAVDACGPVVITCSSVDTTTGCLHVRTIIYTATDICTNRSTCVQLITWRDDTTPPVITLSPPNFQTNFQCLADYQAAPPIVASAWDNCSATNVYLWAISSISGTSPILIDICWTAMDQCSNASTRCVSIIIQDTTPPVIHCPSNITVEFTSTNGAVVTYAVTATDNCAAIPVVTCVPPSGSTFPIGVTTVSCTATDAATNRSFCDFTVTVLGARGMKENVLAELIALRATVTDKEDGKKLDEAIHELTESLEPSLWVDQTHLERKHGEKVFHEEKETVHKLAELAGDKKSTVPPATLQGFITRLVRADRLLAVVSLQEAAAAGANPKKVDEDLRELAKGDQDAAAGKAEQAIEHYRNAWKHAVHLQMQAIHMLLGTVHLQFVGVSGQSYIIQASANLVDWATVGSCTASAEGIVEFDDTSAANSPSRFYRVVIP